jgi:gliding motility-associated-like protein
LTAPAGLASYTWNGQIGTNTYLVDHPQTVTLTVTDANGCQATQDIQVADECPDIRIPNAFTPNGDGINDTWDIIGLEYDQTAMVRVFTRYGQQVYQSKGYGRPWNGEYKGKKLPTGAYYYIINMKNNNQTLSGEVTIIN